MSALVKVVPRKMLFCVMTKTVIALLHMMPASDHKSETLSKQLSLVLDHSKKFKLKSIKSLSQQSTNYQISNKNSSKLIVRVF
jgi:hypothetical protein